MPNLIRCLARVIRLAKRLDVVLIEEERSIAVVWCDVIHLSGRDMITTLQTHRTPWILR
ncbi:MAG: hypothetical protein L0287_02920 [Anaerolineae bacterium]|nr:hypothetical protein [Anaerolineae bacterium]